MHKNIKNSSKFNPFSFCILFLTALLILSACTSQPQECVCQCDCPSGGTAEEQTAEDTAESETSEAVIPEETAEETGGFVPCPIAFDSDRDGNLEIYTMDSNGENLVNLTNDPANDWNPDWSPDGNQIAFVSERNNERSIYIMDADGSNLRLLTNMQESDLADWSPDGKAIIFTSNANGNFEIYIMKADGSNEPINLTNNDTQDLVPVWSPDGSQIAWLSGDEGWDLFVMTSDGHNVRQLTDQGHVSNVKWSIDGNIYVEWDNNVYGSFNCLMDPEGEILATDFGKGDGLQYFPYWTLEGDKAELASVDMDDGNNEIYLIGEIFPDFVLNITNNPGNDENPDWPMLQCGPNQ
jgi:dipeptidyl aminopeptidase/acylaminoacyl peptidase